MIKVKVKLLPHAPTKCLKLFTIMQFNIIYVYMSYVMIENYIYDV